jgi:tetratricopeptide (TPR) repeat protein
MKRFLKITLMTVFLMGGLFACKDSFLDTPPQAALAGETLASSRNGVDATLIAAYKSLLGWTANWSNSSWAPSPSHWIFDVASDEYHKGSEPGDGDIFLQIELFEWSPDNGEFRSKWIAGYEGIVRANSAIRTARAYAEYDATEADYAKQVEAEATFLRGYFHFDLYKVFKNIPYYKENDVDFQKANIAGGEVLNNVIADFEAAISNLPAERAAVGRVDKMVATAFLGKAKLYAGDYSGALSAFNTVISSGRFSLNEDFHDNFQVSTDNSSESILQVQASVNDGAPDGDNAIFGDRLALPHGSSPYGCCGFKNATYDLAFAYRTDANGLPISNTGATLARIPAGSSMQLDPRIDWTMGRTGVPYLDWGNHEDGWIRGQGYQGWYSPKKNAHGKGDASLAGSWAGAQLSNLNYNLMRYADLLLMAAECEVQVGSLEKARGYVNQIRERAGHTAQGASAISVPADSPEITWANYKVGQYTTAWTDKAAALEAVKLERKLELAMEGHRLYDLQRWGDLEKVMVPYLEREKKVVNIMNSATTPSSKNYAFPIPTSEIDRSGGALTQNTGY